MTTTPTPGTLASAEAHLRTIANYNQAAIAALPPEVKLQLLALQAAADAAVAQARATEVAALATVLGLDNGPGPELDELRVRLRTILGLTPNDTLAPVRAIRSDTITNGE